MGSEGVFDVTAIQLAKQSAFGTAQTTATYNWPGHAKIKFEDKIVTPKYSTGEPGKRTMEDAFAASTGTTITLPDTDLSAALSIWALNMAIKGLAGPAMSFAFTLPTSNAGNTLNSFSFKVATNAAGAVYDVADCFMTKFNMHGDFDADNGTVKFNAMVAGRKAAPNGSVTAGLNLVGGLVGSTSVHTASIFNFSNAAFKLSALGASLGTAVQQKGVLKGFSIDCDTGFFPGGYADGRAALDYAQIDGGGLAYDITGKLKLLLSATADGSGTATPTHIANARAAAGKVMQLILTAGNGYAMTAVLPFVFTDEPEFGDSDDKGMIMCEFPFASGPSRTATAVHPSFTVTTGTDITTVT